MIRSSTTNKTTCLTLPWRPRQHLLLMEQFHAERVHSHQGMLEQYSTCQGAQQNIFQSFTLPLLDDLHPAMQPATILPQINNASKPSISCTRPHNMTLVKKVKEPVVCVDPVLLPELSVSTILKMVSNVARWRYKVSSKLWSMCCRRTFDKSQVRKVPM